MRHTALLLALFACGPDPELAFDADAAVATRPHGLRIANWNIEWFGAPDRGPSDEALQLENARAIIAAAEAGLWVVAEISSPPAFGRLVRALPGHAGILASDPQVTDGPRYYRGDEQRVGLIYDPAVVEVRSARLIQTDKIFDFAGRPPLSVELRLELAEGTLDLTVIAVHLKAFGDAESRDRRERAAAAIDAHVRSLPSGRAVLVAGDWNDALFGSTAEGRASPFQALAESPDYAFWTAELATSGVTSFAGGRHFLDHQLANRALSSVWVPHSTRLFEVDRVVDDFATTTSDHFPVVSEIDLHRAISINEILANEPGRDRSKEMIELVNGSCARVHLDHLGLGGEGSPGVDLGGRQLGPGGAIAVFGRAGLGLGNDGGAVTLREASGEALERVAYPRSLAAIDGVSMNRVPDGGRGSTWRLHRALAGSDSSAGRRADGRAFTCPQ